MFTTRPKTRMRIIVAVAIAVTSIYAGSDLAGVNYTQQVRLSSGVAFGGFSTIKIDGNSAVIVAPAGFYIFVRTGTTWKQQAILVPSDGLSVIGSGSAMAISGDTVVIGGSNATINSNVSQGAAYVFVRNGTTWTEQQRLTASDGDASDEFGKDLDISGETIIAGSLLDDIGTTVDQGSAYVFVRQNGLWSEQTKLMASDGSAQQRFGSKVSLDGNTIAISNARRSTNPIPHVYTFFRNGTDWTQQTTLSMCEPSANNFCNFGWSLAISGETLAVGNWALNVGPNIAQGGVYIFTRSGIQWTFQQRITSTVGLADDNFSWSLDIQADTVIVGAPAINSHPGAAYTFTRSGNVWTEQQRFEVSSPYFSNLFGTTVSISGNSIAIGVGRDLGTAKEPIGASYIYTDGNIASSIRPKFDFDGDGKTDISIFRPSLGEWWYLRSSDGGNYAVQFGAGTDKIVPADYTGDGKTDIAFFRPSSGEWFILRSEDSSFYSFPFGTGTDIPVSGDFDGDGIDDPTVFRPSSAEWFTFRSSDGGVTIQTFGVGGDKPLIGDYDNDGKDDIAIYRPSVAQYWIDRSNLGVIAFQFGETGDMALTADFTGDGTSDVGFWRPGTGEWFVIRSEDQSFFAFPFGATGDIPAPGDYDGDGTADATVFRPSTNTWYSFQSTAGTVINGFGAAGDAPVPASSVVQ